MFRDFCPLCGVRRKLEQQRLCLQCEGSEEDLFQNLYAAYFYESGLKDWILQIKRKDWVEAFHELPNESLPASVDFDLVTYIPSSPERKWHPAEEIAKRFCKLRGLPKPQVLFRRKKCLLNQKALRVQDRKVLVPLVFECADFKLAGSERVLIVDDVMASGSSLLYLSKLLAPRVSQVSAFVLARSIRRLGL